MNLPGDLPLPFGDRGARAEAAAEAEAARLATRPPTYFGTLAPWDTLIEWNGHSSRIELRVLEFGEEIDCAEFARHFCEGRTDTDAYLLAEGLARIAYALQAVWVKGARRAVGDDFATVGERRRWVASFPSALVTEINEAYKEGRLAPLAFLEEMHSDPNSDGTLTASGS